MPFCERPDLDTTLTIKSFTSGLYICRSRIRAHSSRSSCHDIDSYNCLVLQRGNCTYTPCLALDLALVPVHPALLRWLVNAEVYQVDRVGVVGGQEGHVGCVLAVRVRALQARKCALGTEADDLMYTRQHRVDQAWAQRLRVSCMLDAKT